MKQKEEGSKKKDKELEKEWSSCWSWLERSYKRKGDWEVEEAASCLARLGQQ